jgi:hypothetical protein
MNSDFFTDGYADKKELESIEAMLFELQNELHAGVGESTGRTIEHVRTRIEELQKKKEEILRRLPHEAEKE